MSQHHPRLRINPPPERTERVIVAVDPGPHFGIATYHPYPGVEGMNFDLRTENIGKEGHGQIEDFLLTIHDGMVETARRHRPKTDDVYDDVYSVLVIEKFEFRKDDAENRSRIDFTAAEYVGVCRFVGWKLFDEVVMQGASEAKGFWTDDKLRALGLYGDTRHGRDALRHLLRFMTFRSFMNQKWLLQALKETPVGTSR